MNIDRVKGWVFSLAIGALLAYNLYSYFVPSYPKVAYIRTVILMEKYLGMVEARQEFEKTKGAMVSNVDSLKLNLDKLVTIYNGQARSMSATERMAAENELNARHEQYNRYSAAIEEKINEEDMKMTNAVLNQINSFIEEYARNEGIDIVFGTTNAGSLLYGSTSFDVTEDVLKKINDQYKGKAKK